MEAAQAQLGHANTAVTEAHYIRRMNSAPDMTEALNTFAPSERQSVGYVLSSATFGLKQKEPLT
ncbi:MAG: hypothetical protein WBG53_01070 [Rhodococcus sp. (in: high G+C Gram-positive bacteria)]|uniref:hypothetical protein n=1 Tax=unclassified Rhodococcus (in: high G+C Gram-positive bacteria) TaxID=192944 RepID=UPI000ACCEA75|nr:MULTISPECIES: hypothetical protein [unclassified Rhodococcus (in: high G+C Gram-positive bacteria)]RMB75444.1 hypothetical protein AYK61_01355 [Rhodococcus sp. SBT000017]